jgi:hypothetical protein
LFPLPCAGSQGKLSIPSPSFWEKPKHDHRPGGKCKYIDDISCPTGKFLYLLIDYFTNDLDISALFRSSR